MASEELPQLNRTFRPLNPGEQDEPDTLSLRLHLGGRSEGETWPDILTRTVAVILGGAGSGKTSELKQQLLRLRKEGIDAFYVRLERLREPSSDLGTAIAVDQINPRDAFIRWKKSDRKAIFLLDAIDEARLPRGENGLVLDQALSALAERPRQQRQPPRTKDWRTACVPNSSP